ncbi:MAG: hypothetical protein ACXWT4_17445 [Methylobacter sp.]
MRVSHYLAVIIIIWSCNSASAAGFGSADDEHARANNIAAFNTYLEGKDRANTLFESNQITFPAYYQRRIEYLQRIDRSKIDRKLSEFFDLRIKQLKEELPIAKQAQADYERLEEGMNATGGMLGYSAAGYGGLGYIVGKSIQTQIESGAKQYMAKYKAQFDQMDALYDRRNKELLNLLTTQYGYPFLSIIYGE